MSRDRTSWPDVAGILGVLALLCAAAVAIAWIVS